MRKKGHARGRSSSAFWFHGTPRCAADAPPVPAEGAVARAGGTNRSVCCVFCSRAARCAVHFSTTSRTEAAGLANPEEGRLEATAPHQPHRRPRSRLPSITEPKAAGTRPRSRTSARQSTAEEVRVSKEAQIGSSCWRQG
ncbi:unnamed protein product [Pleuronectes platessa]|uniref:Uncharacterized protein n=1 Tax=Pleuronectes platessa TaxID=8262 RepID=A0A9N7UFB2_PLEPL|nr:unnamed protein product [Pleuronectes platessa]